MSSRDVLHWTKELIYLYQDQPLDVKFTFDLDQLPVKFGSLRERCTMEILDRNPLNQAIKELVNTIWKAWGFRFRHRRTTKNSGLVYEYHCSQDSSKEKKSLATGKRDIQQMGRFQCESKLRLRPSLENRTLTISLHHLYHSPYVDIHLSPAILEFVSERVLAQTPSEIYQDLLASKILGFQCVAEHQVYYQWLQVNSAKWKRDPDPFISAASLLEESRDAYQHSTYTSGRTRGLAVYIHYTMTTLASESVELAMDATYGTNNAGMELFAVLAELGGTGVPLAYLFLQTLPLETGDLNANQGAVTHVLDQFLRPLQISGFNPTFFGCDKDDSEIAAIRQVWPSTKIQLCLWHAKRAVRTKLRDSHKSNSQSSYHPGDAQKLIPDLEICWGSLPIRRPDGVHRYGGCPCESRPKSFDEKGRIETSSTDERDTVLNMFSRHYNMHPLIPDRNGTYRSAETIHRECTSEVYTWCHARNYFRLWAYLFINWYQPGKWELWARSSNAKEIPVLKTTMIVESHWKKIKHEFLHRHNRPRIDMVIWVLTSRAIPQAIDRMDALRSSDNRKTTASWRKAFKNQWKKEVKKEVAPDSIQKYHTNPEQWTCACDAFLLSRFLLCKHLIHCCEPVNDRVSFFSRICRRRCAPFWAEKQLVIRPEYRRLEITEADADFDPGSDASSDSESDIDPGALEEDKLVTVEDEPTEEVDVDAALSKIQFAMNTCLEQNARGNTKFVKAFLATKGLDQIQMLAEEIQTLQNKRTMPITWSPYKHPATMYYS
jgi:hypothetical protein